MKIMNGYSVIVDDKPNRVGIVEDRNGTSLKLRFSSDGETHWDWFDRKRLRPVAEAIASKRASKAKYSSNLNLGGKGSLGELVAAFGYRTEHLIREDWVERVEHQLFRAGLRLVFADVSRDELFSLEDLDEDVERDPDREEAAASDERSVALPDPFWPRVLGLAAEDELMFLRALTDREPVLCLLELPDSAGNHLWLQPTWEGLVGWAYIAAQRFVRHDEVSDQPIVRGSDLLLQQHLKPGSLPGDVRLLDSGRHLNLVTLSRGARPDLHRLRAGWPGALFVFRPGWASDAGGTLEPQKALLELMFLAGGRPRTPSDRELQNSSPLHVLGWSRTAGRQLLAAMTPEVSALVAEAPKGGSGRFRGSNESGTALALKALAGAWAHRRAPHSRVAFEETTEQVEVDGEAVKRSRQDLCVKGVGVFEIESMACSGPIEEFCARKVYSRLNHDEPFHLVVPGDAIVWAGPYLADIAARLGDRGRVMVPVVHEGKDGEPIVGLAALQGRAIAGRVQFSDSTEGTSHEETKTVERRLTLDDIAGYDAIRRLIEDEVIWARRNPRFSRGAVGAPGILFYGPPGCGKSRVARAICGELAQEVRLLGPADFKGLYIGWGQHLVREQFDWLFEGDDRVLLIDEFDAIARSRTTVQMHSDEKADVNELLVQLDRAGRYGRMVLATTNYVASLDEAVLRNGRFGHFVPVPPPDAEESVAIVRYHLARLGEDPDGRRLTGTSVEVPREDAVRHVVFESFADTRTTGRFCGADLEAIVGAVYRRKAREASANAGRDRTEVVIEIAPSDLAAGFRVARRSIGLPALTRFLGEVRAHSPSEIYDRLQADLGIDPAADDA